MKALVSTTSSYPMTFNESSLFTSSTTHVLKKQFKQHFRNISRIMDCVGCEKCRLWGKLQVQGLGTALKILFSYDTDERIDFELKRNEIVSLFNFMGRLSESLHELGEYRARTRKIPSDETILPLQYIDSTSSWLNFFTQPIVAIVLVLATTLLLVSANRT